MAWSGGRWRDLPERLGDYRSVKRRYYRWIEMGVLDANQAIGRSRGGHTTKIHALTDAECRPVAFLLTGGHIADCTARGAAS
jgi:transposase